MTKAIQWTKRGAIAAALLAAVVLGVMETAKSLYDPDKLRGEIIDTARRDFGLDVRFGKLRFARFGLGVVIPAPHIEGGEVYANASSIEASVDLMSLVAGKPRLALLTVADPMVFVRRYADGHWNVDPLIERIRATPSAGIPGRVVVVGGHLALRDDQGSGAGHETYHLAGLEAQFRNGGWLLPLKAKARGELLSPQGAATIDVALESRMKEPDWDWHNRWMEGRVSVESLDARRFEAYIKRFLPEQHRGKLLSVDLNFSGLPADRLDFTGNATARTPGFVSSSSISAAGDAGYRRLAFSGTALPERIAVERLEVVLPEVTLTGNLSVGQYRSKDPDIQFKMSTSLVNIKKLATLVPPTYADEPMVKFVEKTVGKGQFKFTDIAFNGPYSAFENLKDPANLNLLSGKVELLGTSFKLERMRRPVSGINGLFAVSGNRIIFSRVNAAYGGSRLNIVSGAINDYHTAPQLFAVIDADVDVAEFRDELMSRIGSPRLHDLLAPVVEMHGAMNASFSIEMDVAKPEVTNLDGKLVLKEIGFQHGLYNATIQKLGGTLHVTKNAIDIQNVLWSMGQSAFSARGSIADYRSPDYRFDLTIATSGDMAKLANTRFFNLELFRGIEGPVRTSLRLSGNLDTFAFSHQADFTQADMKIWDMVKKPRGLRLEEHVSGKVTDKNRLHIDTGTVVMGNQSVSYTGDVKDLRTVKEYDVSVNLGKLDLGGLKGYLARFEGASGSLEGHVRAVRGKGKSSARLLAHVDRFDLRALSSFRELLPILGDLQAQGILSGSVDAALKEGTLRMSGRLSGRDIGLSTGLTKRITAVRGDAVLEGNAVRFRKIPVKAGTSSASVSGTILVKEDPEFNLMVNAETLDLADAVEGERYPERPEGDHPVHPRFHLDIRSKNGLLGALGYSNLHAAFGYHKNRLDFDEISFTSHKGKCSASGAIAFGEGLPGFDIAMRVKNVEMESLFHELWPEMDKVTGRLEGDGRFHGTGLLWADLRKTLGGGMRFKAEDGLLGQFAGLSSVFSVINVVPIFQSRSGSQQGAGLPYDTVAGSMAITNGVGHTENIMLEGSVVRMSGVGDFDFSKGTVNLLIGVKPFTTVDTIISNIPIAGPLLTGEQKSFMVSYFEVKGDMANPVSTSVPGESVARNVFGIFKRILEAPGKALSTTPGSSGVGGEKEKKNEESPHP